MSNQAPAEHSPKVPNENCLEMAKQLLTMATNCEIDELFVVARRGSPGEYTALVTPCASKLEMGGFISAVNHSRLASVLNVTTEESEDSDDDNE